MTDIISGISNLTIGGVPYSLTDASVKVDFQSIEQKPVLGKDGNVYITRTPVAAKISFTIIVNSTVNPTIFNGMTGAKIVAQQEGGFVLNANQMFQTGSLEYGMGEGTLTLEFSGKQINFTQTGS
jgi:hypothetical protein